MFLRCFLMGGGEKLRTAAASKRMKPSSYAFVALPDVGLNTEALEEVTKLSF